MIHKFATKEDAENWWLLLCEHRGQPERKLKEGPPPPKTKNRSMGPATIDTDKATEMAKAATKSGYEPT